MFKYQILILCTDQTKVILNIALSGDKKAIQFKKGLISTYKKLGKKIEYSNYKKLTS